MFALSFTENTRCSWHEKFILSAIFDTWDIVVLKSDLHNFDFPIPFLQYSNLQRRCIQSPWTVWDWEECEWTHNFRSLKMEISGKNFCAPKNSERHHWLQWDPWFHRIMQIHWTFSLKTPFEASIFTILNSIQTIPLQSLHQLNLIHPISTHRLHILIPCFHHLPQESEE